MDVVELLELDGFEVVEAKDEIIHQHEYKILTLKSNQKRPSCPHCGSHNCYSNGTRSKDVRDLDIVGKHTILRIKTRQFKCNECGRLFTEKHDFINANAAQTVRFESEVGYKTLNEAFESVAERYDISKTETKYCFDNWLKAQDYNRIETIYAPEVLGIDEAHLCP